MPESALNFIDPVELDRITDLELIARTVVAGMSTGLHKSLHTGVSVEFAQYRPYAQGDEPRFVDWRLYGRTDRLHIKQFQQETNLRFTVLLDCSASMAYGSEGISKFRYAQMLSASLVMLMSGQRDTVGFAAYHHELCIHIPARAQVDQVRRILVAIDNLEPAGQTDTASALQHMGNVLAPRGMVVLITDLLHPVEDVMVHLRSLRAQRHDLMVFQISDPAEKSFPFDRSVTLVDAEQDREQFVVPEAMRDAYLENRARHFEAIRQECLAGEIDVEEFICTEPLDRALHHLIRRRNHALFTSSRRQGVN